MYLGPSWSWEIAIITVYLQFVVVHPGHQLLIDRIALIRERLLLQRLLVMVQMEMVVPRACRRRCAAAAGVAHRHVLGRETAGAPYHATTSSSSSNSATRRGDDALGRQPKTLDERPQVLEDGRAVAGVVAARLGLLVKDVNRKVDVVGLGGRGRRRLLLRRGQQLLEHEDDGGVEDVVQAGLQEFSGAFGEVEEPAGEEQVAVGGVGALADSGGVVLDVPPAAGRDVALGKGLLDGYEEDGPQKQDEVLFSNDEPRLAGFPFGLFVFPFGEGGRRREEERRERNMCRTRVEGSEEGRGIERDRNKLT